MCFCFALFCFLVADSPTLSSISFCKKTESDWTSSAAWNGTTIKKEKIRSEETLMIQNSNKSFMIQKQNMRLRKFLDKILTEEGITIETVFQSIPIFCSPFISFSLFLNDKYWKWTGKEYVDMSVLSLQGAEKSFPILL